MSQQTMSLREWARLRGVAARTAYRWFHDGKMPPGVHAEKLPSGRILVTTNLLDPLDLIDPHELVARLHAAGYVVLTLEQAAQLGVQPKGEPPQPRRARAGGR